MNIQERIRPAALKDLIYLIVLGCIICFFCTLSIEHPLTYKAGLALFFGSLAAVFVLWLFMLSGAQAASTSLINARLSLCPLLLPVLLIPYNYFYATLTGLEPVACLSLACTGCFIFNAILNNPPAPLPRTRIYVVVGVVYAAVFSALSVLRHINFQDASSFDVAIYSQIQWNNIHGHFFHSSASGSNFVTHNSPFLILLSPLYALWPHPENLLVLKTVFLALGAWPLYLVLKDVLAPRTILPLVLGYLFFPFIVGQNFNAPHETCFLTPFLLFSYYFFAKNRFVPFLVFLFLCLSIKEHMALMSIVYGFYALRVKKEKHWVMVPIVLGVAWAVFSMWIIAHFQHIYHVDPYPAWLIDNIKRRMLRPDHTPLSNLIWSLKTSNMGHWCNFSYVYLLLSPALVILPFFSVLWVLGLPELSINLLATVPLTYPTWHYNVVASTFLLLSCALAIRKLSSWNLLRLGLPAEKSQELLSWLLCLCILIHFPIWWEYTAITIDPRYVADMNSAIAQVPLGSSVSLTKHLVAYVSDRKDYFLCEDRRKGEYIVLDQGESMRECFTDMRPAANYKLIFNKDSIRVYRRMKAIP